MTPLPLEKELDAAVAGFLKRWGGESRAFRHNASQIAYALEMLAVSIRMYQCLIQQADSFAVVYDDLARAEDLDPEEEVLMYLPLHFQLDYTSIIGTARDADRRENWTAYWAATQQTALAAHSALDAQVQRAETACIEAFLVSDIVDRAQFCRHFRLLMECYDDGDWRGFEKEQWDNASFLAGSGEDERMIAAGASQHAYGAFNLLVKRFIVWWTALGYELDFFGLQASTPELAYAKTREPLHWACRPQLLAAYPPLQELSPEGQALLVCRVEEAINGLDVEALIRAGVLTD